MMGIKPMLLTKGARPIYRYTAGQLVFAGIYELSLEKFFFSQAAISF
jgi:hypothetical protein